MKCLIPILLLLAACQVENKMKPIPPTRGIVTSSPSSSPDVAAAPPSVSGPKSSASSTTSTSTAARPETTSTPREEWLVLKDMSILPGKWKHQSRGDSHPKGKLVKGGVRAIFVKDSPDSRTPWNLKFWAPREGHMGAKTVAGGCGFYEELHDHAWRTAFCKGYGLGVKKGLQLKLHLHLDYEKKQLRIKIGDLLDEVLVKP